MLKHCRKNIQSNEYLGSDGMSISTSYELYLQQCQHFQEKAKEYKQQNLLIRKSMLQHCKLGYKGSEEFERDVLEKRQQQFDHYAKIFNASAFHNDSSLMYECFTGHSRRIRILRNLYEHGREEFSEDFGKRNKCWFSRYYTLSQFIQAARMVIIKNRLSKILHVLNNLTLDNIQQIEQQNTKEQKEFI